MKICADTHTHTIACQHAYSTLLENVAWAKKIGLRAIANTEHAPSISGAPFIWYITNQKIIPEVIDGVIVLKGVEANVLDWEGHLDVSDERLAKLDWVIASCHVDCLTPGTVEEHTRAYLKLAENPHVDVIGHCGDERFRFDYERVIPVFGREGKIVEINNHSFAIRPGSAENCREIALLGKKHGVRVVVNTDAHFAMEIGQVPQALAMLESIDFPEELVVNADFDRFLALAREKSGRRFID